MQAPPWHASSLVRPRLPSLQAVPSGARRVRAAPVAGSQVPASWHWSRAVQTTGFAADADAGLAGVGLRAGVAVVAGRAVRRSPGSSTCPSPGSHVPASWHWSLAVQTTGFAPAQAPAWHVSVCVQALPSLQAVPFGLARVGARARRRVAGARAWHWSLRRADDGVRAGADARLAGVGLRAGVAVVAGGPVGASRVGAGARRGIAGPGDVALVAGAAQTTGLAPVHAPAWHVSVCVQALPSLQAVPSAFAGLEQVPVAGSQVPAPWH